MNNGAPDYPGPLAENFAYAVRSVRGVRLHSLEGKMKLTNLLLSLIAVAASASAAERTVDWKNSLEVAFKEAVASHRLLIVEFRGTDCPWCAKLEAEVQTAPDKMSTSVVYVRLNPDFDDAQENVYHLAKKLGVTRYPSVFVLEVSDATIVSHGCVVGYKTHERFFEELSVLINQARPGALTAVVQPDGAPRRTDWNHRTFGDMAGRR